MSLKSWERRGKRGLTRALGRALRTEAKAAALPVFADLGRILLIRQQNQLGDMLLTTPVFRAVRQAAPRARIDMISGLPNHDAVYGNPHLDEVLLYDKMTFWRRPSEGKRFADRLREVRYDLALVLSTVSFSHTSVWLAALSRARYRVGRPGPGGRGAESARDLYHWVLPEPREGRHQSGVNLDLVAALGAPGDSWIPEIFPTREEEEEGRRALDLTLGAGGRALRIVIHPGAGKPPNRWPADRFGDVARALVAEGHRVAVVAGPSETGLLRSMDGGAGESLPRLPGVGFRVLAGALREADLLLANDTGILHLGAAVGIPVLALFGPTDPEIWCPAQPSVRTLRAPGGDLRRLETARVREAAVGLAASLAGTGDAPAELGRAPEPVP